MIDLGFVSAILADQTLDQVLDTASSLGFSCVEVMCWPKGKAERRYAGVTHIDVGGYDAADIQKKCRDKNVYISGLGYYPNPLDADEAQGAEHIVLSKGDLTTPDPVLVRMHSLDPLHDVLGIGREDAGDLSAAMRLIGEEGRGVVVLFRDLEKALPAQGEVSPHVLRQYGLGAQILSSLGLSDLIVLTNSAPVKVVGLDAYGLSIHSTRSIPKE